MNPIALPFQDGDVGVVRQPVEQGCNAGGVGKHVAPLREAVGRDDDGTPFIASVDDFIEQIGRVIVIGQIAKLVDAE